MKTAGISLVLFVLASTLAASNASRAASGPASTPASVHAMHPDDRIQIKVHFDQPVDHRRLVPGRTFVLSTENQANIRGSLHWSADRRSIIFRSFQTVGELFKAHPRGRLNLRLDHADAGQAVVQAAGSGRDAFHDGDGEERPGSHVEVSLTIAG